MNLPNFLHLGPGKAGSTWVHEALSTHPEVFLTPAKDLYFFSRFYDHGPDWYAGQFKSAPPDSKVIGEVCPEYLWCPEAAARIHETLGPGLRIMVTLRDPVTRAFSAYLYQQKHGVTGRAGSGKRILHKLKTGRSDDRCLSALRSPLLRLGREAGR